MGNLPNIFKDFPGLIKFKDFPGQQKNLGLFQDGTTLFTVYVGARGWLKTSEYRHIGEYKIVQKTVI